jgi:hypothetical protein
MTSPLQQIRDNFDAGQATFTREDVHTLLAEIEARGRALKPFADKFHKLRYTQSYYRVPSEIMDKAAEALKGA